MLESKFTYSVPESHYRLSPVKERVDFTRSSFDSAQDDMGLFLFFFPIENNYFAQNGTITGFDTRLVIALKKQKGAIRNSWKNDIICTMKLWDDIRNYFYRKSIERKLDGIKPERLLTNLHDAKSVGIVYDGTNPDNDSVITKFAEGLRQEGKTVDILGFVNEKEIKRQSDNELFCKKNLGWTMIPNDQKVEAFAGKDFDLLFAAFPGENLPLEYVARTSQAKWRVGTFDEKKTDYYEMMIKTGEHSDLQYFLDQSTYFLNKIQYDSK